MRRKITNKVGSTDCGDGVLKPLSPCTVCEVKSREYTPKALCNQMPTFFPGCFGPTVLRPLLGGPEGNLALQRAPLSWRMAGDRKRRGCEKGRGVKKAAVKEKAGVERSQRAQRHQRKFAKWWPRGKPWCITMEGKMNLRWVARPAVGAAFARLCDQFADLVTDGIPAGDGATRPGSSLRPQGIPTLRF